jgi:hypothetical protein
VIPNWTNSNQLEPGAQSGLPTPRQLGLKVHEFVHLRTIVAQEVDGILVLPDLGKITSIEPSPGTSVVNGFTVTIHSIGRRSIISPQPEGTIVERFID